MQRFLSPSPLLDNVIILREDSHYHQITRVLRLKIGDSVVFFEPHGPDYEYALLTSDKKSLLFQKKITSKIMIPSVSMHNFMLIQSLPHSAERLEVLTQKIVEIGVPKIVLFHSEYSQVNTKNPRIDRLNKIALEALEQSGGNVPITIEVYQTIQAVFDAYPTHTPLIASLSSNTVDIPTILSLVTKEKPLGLWIGPEGGWSPAEEELFKKKKSHFWRFNPHILRLETAGIVGCGILAFVDSTFNRA